MYKKKGLLYDYLSYQRIIKSIPYFIPGKVLDVGSGDNRLKEFINGSEYFFLDDEFDLNNYLINGSFDSIFFLAILEHLKDPKELLNSAYDSLNPGGRIIITSPSPFGDKIHHFLSHFNLTTKEAHGEHINLRTLDGWLSYFREKKMDMKIVCANYFELGCNQLIVIQKNNG